MVCKAICGAYDKHGKPKGWVGPLVALSIMSMCFIFICLLWIPIATVVMIAELSFVIHQPISFPFSQSKPFPFSTILPHFIYSSLPHYHSHVNHHSCQYLVCGCFPQCTKQAPAELNMEGRPQYWVEASKKGEMWLFCREGTLAASWGQPDWKCNSVTDIYLLECGGGRKGKVTSTNSYCEKPGW